MNLSAYASGYKFRGEWEDRVCPRRDISHRLAIQSAAVGWGLTKSRRRRNRAP